MKILLIRFSSFGDVTQCLSVPTRLKELGRDSGEGKPGARPEIHWVTRQDFSHLLENHPAIDRIWKLDRKEGFAGLWRLAFQLRQQKFTHVYDAHNNFRSRLISLIVRPQELLRKSQKRFLRFLLFRFRINRFEMPFSGQRDLLEPLTEWGLSKKLPLPPQLFLPNSSLQKAKELLGSLATQNFVALAASAAYPLKRWPVEHWKELIRQSSMPFVLLGGPEDRFLNDLAAVAPERVLNLAGKSSLTESAAVVSLCQALIANDTGLLHVAEQLGKRCIALMGPAPFGFPSRPSTRILEISLSCRPCSKHGQGPCKNSEHQKCLVDIRPAQVRQELEKLLERTPSFEVR